MQLQLRQSRGILRIEAEVLPVGVHFAAHGGSSRRLVAPGSWFLVEVGGTWMQGARYVGYRSTGGGLFFFDTRGQGDPTEFLRGIQQAKATYFDGMSDPESRGSYGFRRELTAPPSPSS